MHTTGVDVKAQSREHNTAVAASLGLGDADDASCRATSARPSSPSAPDVVLALHACDTATDDALARAVTLGGARSCSPRPAATTTSRPSCAARRPRRRTPCSPAAASCASGSPTRSPTRCGPSVLRLVGYRVDVIEFVDSKHTPRNTLLRAVRTGAARVGRARRRELDEVTGTWGVHPRLAELLRDRLA